MHWNLREFVNKWDHLKDFLLDDKSNEYEQEYHDEEIENVQEDFDS